MISDKENEEFLEKQFTKRITEICYNYEKLRELANFSCDAHIKLNINGYNAAFDFKYPEIKKV